MDCMNLEFPFSEEDIQIVKEICTALKPLELVVKTLSEKKCNLVTAEAALSFAMKELQCQDSHLGKQVEASLEKRLKERRSFRGARRKFSRGGRKFSRGRQKIFWGGRKFSRGQKIFWGGGGRKFSRGAKYF